jgi:hypothetical protein
MPALDFSIFDGQELVTYTPLVGSSVDDVAVLRRPLTQSRQRNVERYIELQVDDVVFHFDASVLAAVTLSLGDSFIDRNNVAYTVVFFERQALDRTIAVVGRPIV